MIETDVTRAREFIRKHKEATGETLSFAGWIVKCVAHAVEEHKDIQGMRKGKRKLVAFDDVDVLIVVAHQETYTQIAQTATPTELSLILFFVRMCSWINGVHDLGSGG